MSHRGAYVEVQLPCVRGGIAEWEKAIVQTDYVVSKQSTCSVCMDHFQAQANTTWA